MANKLTTILAALAATVALGTAATFIPVSAPESEPIASGTEITINETGEPVFIEETEPATEIETVEAPIEAPVEIEEPAPIETQAPTEIETKDEGFPLPEYGDGCRSYDDQPNWIICPTEAYSADRRVTLTICEQEDSRNCYWDAKRMGNGLGTSFVNIEGIIYTPSDRSE